MSYCMCAPCCLNPSDEDVTNLLDIHQNTEIPVKNRKQTDLPYFLILILLLLSLVLCVGVAGGRGDIRRVIYGYDDKGNICGSKNAPIEDVDGSGLDLTEMKFLQIGERCEYDVCSTERKCVQRCADGYEPSMMSRCFKKESKNKLETFDSFLEMVYLDISLCWREIIVLCFGSICLSGLYLTLLRKFARVVIWTVFLIISIAAIGAIIFFWTEYAIRAGAKKDSIDLNQEEKHSEELYWMMPAILITIFTVFYFFLLYSLKKKMNLIVALFEEGGKCIANIPMLLLQPVLTHLITTVFVVFACYGFFYLQSSGEAEIEGNKVYFPVNVFFQVTTWLLIFALLWISQFILACQNLVIAGAVSSWYFLRVKGQLFNPVWNSFSMIVKHHLGSAAFGSLLIAFIKFLRIINKLLERRGRINAAALIWKLFQCLLCCLESLLKILNKSAYVMIVLFGEPFCSSARKAFDCMTRDASRVAVVIGVGTIVLTAIELLITFSVTFVAVAVFMNMENVQVFWIPTGIVFVLSYLCCHCIFSVYDMTIDTLILCFCVDHQMNSALEKPYYMNTNIMILLNEDDINSKEMAPGNNGNVNNMQVMI